MEINARFDKYVLGQFQHEYSPVLNVQKKNKAEIRSETSSKTIL